MNILCAKTGGTRPPGALSQLLGPAKPGAQPARPEVALPHRAVLCGTAVLLLLGGCASPPPVVLAPLPAPAAVPSSALPLAGEGDRLPVYRNPKIGKIYLRAHEDANGRLVGPQVIYQIVEPGGWNVAAIEQGEPRASDPRLRESAPTIVDPAAGWMLEPAEAAQPPAGTSGVSSQPTALK
jgi:hypothetical protein